MSVLLATSLLGACIGMSEEDGAQSGDLVGQPEPPMLGVQNARDGKPSGGGGGGGGSPDLVYHSGQLQTAGTQVTAIYWGTSWASASYAGDKISGLDLFYQGIGGSPYFKTTTEYTDASNIHVSSAVTFSGDVLDTSSSLAHAPSQTSTILAEVCKMIPNPVAYAYYPVYTDLPRGHASYCAYHSYGSCNGVPVQFGFFFSLDGDPGCDTTNYPATQSQGLAALANVSGHEISEMVTDPRNGGYWDSSGYENADKCAWTFNGTETFTTTTTVTNPDGSTTTNTTITNWLIQGNWSNAAYDNGQTGYTKGGCINSSTSAY